MIETLNPFVRDGQDIVVIEPSDHALFQREYERLIDEDSFDRLASNMYEIMEFVYGHLENDEPADSEQIIYHSHCQQRMLGLEVNTVAVLE